MARQVIIQYPSKIATIRKHVLEQDDYLDKYSGPKMCNCEVMKKVVK